MSTHVLIVDTDTFAIHLEYLFVGTGAKDYQIDFNNSYTSNLHHKRELTLVGMMADFFRIRKGDYIIFYLQQNKREGIQEGRFYGVFRARENWCFLDKNDSNQYLRDKLGKSLTFRNTIKPYEVYSKGVTEWEALDEIKAISSPHQMLWSLIYRKLKGNRGNTMITTYESERLRQLIRRKNDLQALDCDNKELTFNEETKEIVCKETKNLNRYQGRKEKISLFPRLKRRYEQNKSFEKFIQAYIVKHVGLGENLSLDKAILNEYEAVEWIGNEVGCGVGMQRIDIALLLKAGGHKTIAPIELKTGPAKPKITAQLQRYVDWLEQYYLPNEPVDILPMIVSEEISKSTKGFNKLRKALKRFNKTNKVCKKLKYVEFSIEEKKIEFIAISY